MISSSGFQTEKQIQRSPQLAGAGAGGWEGRAGTGQGRLASEPILSEIQSTVRAAGRAKLFACWHGQLFPPSGKYFSDLPARTNGSSAAHNVETFLMLLLSF